MEGRINMDPNTLLRTPGFKITEILSICIEVYGFPMLPPCSLGL